VTGPRKQPGPDREAELERDRPAPAASPAAAGGTLKLPTPVAVPPPATRAWLLMVPALTLVVGLAAGFALGSRRGDGDQVRATVTSPPATRAPAPPTSVVVKLTATSACVETARRADQIIDRLVTNKRDRIAELLVPYNVASRQCRRDASP
jgi:hypothetical protein